MKKHINGRRRTHPMHSLYRLLLVGYFMRSGLSQKDNERQTKSTTSKWYIHPNHPDDPEPDVFDPVSKDQKDYWDQQFPGSGYLGLLFAGKSEFIWIVDIRIVDDDQESWSIGNLLTYHHVLTTCRAIATLRKHNLKEVNKNRGVAGNLEDSEIRINYCTQYLWEEYKFKTDSEKPSQYERFRTSGTRTVDAMVTHSRCASNTFKNDIGIIHLSKGISPYAPLIGYMPLPLNLETGELYTPDLRVMEQQRWVCYIASYGKKYRNLENAHNIPEITLDYKIKFRVYYVNWEKCKQYFEILCPETEPACARYYSPNDLLKIMCFRPRTKVGAICDHDKGAPLVCDGKAFGIVVRGVQYDYCHDLTPFPAIVLITDIYHEYFASLISFNFIAPDSFSSAENVKFHLSSIALMVICSKLSMWFNGQ